MEQNDNKPGYETVDATVFADEIKNPETVLIDVRHPDEYATGHIAGAENIDVLNDDFINKVESQLSKDKTVAVYCGLGKRSPVAAEKLSDAGYKVLNLAGGLQAWKQAGFSVE